MIDPNATIDFHGADISLSTEYHEARKLMGLKTTNLDDLIGRVAQVYMNIPEAVEGWGEQYLALVHEIEWRQQMVLSLELGLQA